jgi:hypothetical protein
MIAGSVARNAKLILAIASSLMAGCKVHPSCIDATPAVRKYAERVWRGEGVVVVACGRDVTAFGVDGAIKGRAAAVQACGDHGCRWATMERAALATRVCVAKILPNFARVSIWCQDMWLGTNGELTPALLRRDEHLQGYGAPPPTPE